jgi:MFS transporter, DHA1 family, multidrug resistance protein B
MSVKQLHANVKIRIVVSFFQGVAFMMVMPFLAIYFAEKVGATITGFLFVSVILCGIAGGVLGGFYGDRLGRKRIMLWGDFATVIGFILIALVNSPWYDFPYVTYVIFLFAQFFSGIAMPAAQALLIDSSTSETRRLIFQIQYWVGNLSTALGSVIGAFLFQAHHFSLFLLVAFVTLVSFFITLFFIEDNYIPATTVKSSEDTQPKEKGGFLKNYAFVIKDRVFMFFTLASFFTLTIEGQLTNYVGVRMAKEIPNQPLFGGIFGFHVNGVRLLGFLQSENTILVVFGTFLVAWVVKKMNNQAAIVTGVAIFTTGYTYLMFGTIPSLLMMMMFVTTMGELTYVPIKQAYLADIAPDDARSSYMAANSMIQMFSMIFAGFMITIGSLLTPGIMAGIIAALGLCGAAFFYLSGQLLKRARSGAVHHIEQLQKSETI